jgi:hypothetical protein
VGCAGAPASRRSWRSATSRRPAGRSGDCTGRSRPPNLTPRAYERTVQDLVPGERQALRTLTDAYMLARYSPDAPTEEQVREADRALHRIEAELEHR